MSESWIDADNWLHNLSEIKPGNSAIIGGHKLTFYGIHAAGIILSLVSLGSSLAVIFSILSANRIHLVWTLKRRKLSTDLSTNCGGSTWDFSDRFPLYMAVADTLWSIVNLGLDHAILLITRKFPDKTLETFLAVSLGFFLR